MAHFAQLENQHQRNVNRLLMPFGLKHREWRVLVFVNASESVSVTQLAENAVIDRSTIGKLLARLKEKGWVTEAKSQGDARENPVRLTASGRTLVKRTAPMIAALFEQYRGPLTATEHQELMRLLLLYRQPVFAPSSEALVRPRLDQSPKLKRAR